MRLWGFISDLKLKIEEKDALKAGMSYLAVHAYSKSIRRMLTLMLIREWFLEDGDDFRREFCSLLDRLESGVREKTH